jgi:nicotinate phosphoribosyltransferase
LSVTNHFHVSPGCSADLLDLAVEHRKNLTNVLRISTAEASDGELAAMVSFAIAFPNGFMALVDTYDVKRYIFSFWRFKYFRIFPIFSVYVVFVDISLSLSSNLSKSL